MTTDDTTLSDDPSADDSGAPDFNDGGDTSFVAVTESKQPMSKGTVGMFVVLALAGAGTYFMYARTGPQAAKAATDVKAQQVIKQYMSERDKNTAAMQKMLRDTESVVQQFLNYPGVKQVPLSNLSGNPFRLADAPPADGAAPKPDDAREKKRREEERLAVLRAVNALQLQSVMHSDVRKACMLNNTLYTEGQQVDGFTIEKITPHSVIVRQNSYRFELRMQR